MVSHPRMSEMSQLESKDEGAQGSSAKKKKDK